MNFLDENGVIKLWEYIVAKFNSVVKKEDIATEVTETEENPVSGMAVAAYIAENSNNDAAGKNVAEQTFNTFWDKETETFNTAVANEGAEIFNDYRERAIEIFEGEDDYEVEYQGNIAIGEYSHTEGIGNAAVGTGSHAEGYNTIAGGERVIWEDEPPIITEYDHAEGYMTQAIGGMSHAEGSQTIALGGYSHAEGQKTQARGGNSHAEGRETFADGGYSHAEGYGTIAEGPSQHVQGEYNIADGLEYLHIVGNGSADRRSNAHTLDWDGNAWYAGDVYVGSTSGTNKDEGSKKLATEEYVNNSLNNINNQPDWAQNDETASDYIKNRTHYEVVETVTLLDNQTLTVIDNGDYSYKYPVSSNHEIVLLPNSTYEVTIRGITLQCETHYQVWGNSSFSIYFDFAPSELDTVYSGFYDLNTGEFFIQDDMAGLAYDIPAEWQITVTIVGPKRQVLKTLSSYFLNFEEAEAKIQLYKVCVPLVGGKMKGALYASSNYQYASDSLLRNTKLSATEATPTTNGEIVWMYA